MLGSLGLREELTGAGLVHCHDPYRLDGGQAGQPAVAPTRIEEDPQAGDVGAEGVGRKAVTNTRYASMASR